MKRDKERQLLKVLAIPVPPEGEQATIIANLKKLESKGVTKLFEAYEKELSANLFEITDGVIRYVYIKENLSLIHSITRYGYKVVDDEYDELDNRGKIIYQKVSLAMAISQEIEYQCLNFLIDFPSLLKKAHFNTDTFMFLQEWDNLKNTQETKSERKLTPIRWNGDPGQLIFLFEILRNNSEFLSSTLDVHATIREHFRDETGEPFKALKQTKQNYLNNKTSKPKKAETLELLKDILRRLK